MIPTMTRTFLLLMISSFLSGCATLPTPAVQAEPESSGFLLVSQIPLDGGLPPPPLVGTKAAGDDFLAILRAQNSRTAEDCKRAVSEETTNLTNFYGAPYGPFTERELSPLQPFFEKVRKETKFFTARVKESWGRMRPYQADPKIKPCVRYEESSAYPSGHTTAAVVMGNLLEILHPSMKAKIRARRKVIIQDRVIGGVHHPSDLRAGEKFGALLFSELMKSPAFLEELEALKAKLK